LVQHGQTAAAIERFWKPILVSALSEDLDQIAIPYAAQVVRESMKAPEARRMGIPSVPLTNLYDAAQEYVTLRGGSVRFRNGVQSVAPSERDIRLRVQDSEEEFDYGIAAVPFDSLAKLLPDLPEASNLKRKLAIFKTSPITGVHLWFDRKISALPHAILLDRTIQWMFHKSVLLDRSESGTTENGMTSVVPTIDSETQARATASVGTPSYVELVISSSKSLIDKSRQEIIDLALRELREFFPGARNANLVKATVIKEVNATFSPVPAIDRYRPTNATPWPRLFLAGDWTATGWPATMEGAVRSGYLAAGAVARQAGNPKVFLVPDLHGTGFMRLFG
jgi:zeta-carotene desaturase